MNHDYYTTKVNSLLPKFDKAEFSAFLDSVDDDFTSSPNTDELLSYAKELVLNQPNELRVVEVCGTSSIFKVNLESKICNSAEVDSFIRCFETSNNVTLRIETDKSKNLTTKRRYSNIRYYQCQHKTRCISTRDVCQIKMKNPSKRQKNTNCPFTMCTKILKGLTNTRVPLKYDGIITIQ